MVYNVCNQVFIQDNYGATMKNNLISIIIPTYNRAAYLYESITSALEQTHTNIEVIVIDDGSTDDTREIIYSLQDQRVTYHYVKHHGVVSKNRNKAISKAKGEFIAFLDSDDVWKRNKVENQLHKIQQYNLEAAFSNVDILHEHNGTLHSLEFPDYISNTQDNEEILDLILTNKLAIYASTMLLKTSILQKIGVQNTSLIISEMEFMSRIIAHSKIILDKTPLVTIRKHGNNISVQSLENNFKEKFLLINELYKKQLISKKKHKNSLLIHYHSILKSTRPKLNLKQGLKYFCKGLLNNPLSLGNITSILKLMKNSIQSVKK